MVAKDDNQGADDDKNQDPQTENQDTQDDENKQPNELNEMDMVILTFICSLLFDYLSFSKLKQFGMG